MKYIKQYGIQRSGTNYMRAVFEMNTDCRVLSNIGGFKHGKITNVSNFREIKSEIPREEILRIDKMLQANEITRIVIIRQPFSWIPSIARYLNKPITNDFIKEQLDRYIELNSHWATECDYTIYFDELLQCPECIINDCVKEIGLTRITDEIVLPKGYMKRGGDIPAEKNVTSSPFNRKYIDDKLYLSKLTKEQINLIKDISKDMWFLNLKLIQK